MEWHLFFEILILGAIIILILFALKAFLTIVLIKKAYQNRFNQLKTELHLEIEKSKSIHQKTILIDNLNKTLHKRAFTIIQAFLVFQKLIFEKDS